MSNQQTFLSRAVTRIYTNIWYSRDHDAILWLLSVRWYLACQQGLKGERR
jgi:hypothetical protein